MLAMRVAERSAVRPGKALSYTAVVNARSALRLGGHVTRHDHRDGITAIYRRTSLS
jgi:hypothetical protein